MADELKANNGITVGDAGKLSPEVLALVQAHEEKLKYLEELRQSGVTNMFGAGPYLQQRFGMGLNEAIKLLSTWMQHYGELSEYYGWQS